MSTEISIPREIPVMTLANTVLFPHAMLPLYIFEPRYRQMLADVLAGGCMFVVAREDVERADETGEFEPACAVASVGVVRASHRNDDGTSHLVLQGLARVRLCRVLREDPYRVGEFEALPGESGEDEAVLLADREALAKLVCQCRSLGSEAPDEVFDFLDSLQDPETYLDLASFTLCQDSPTKQRLLETLGAHARFVRLMAHLRQANEGRRLENHLRGKLDLDALDRN